MYDDLPEDVSYPAHKRRLENSAEETPRKPKLTDLPEGILHNIIRKDGEYG